MGKWGHCMILGVEVGCTGLDRATSAQLIFRTFAECLGSVPTVPTANTYILTDSVKKGAKFHVNGFNGSKNNKH